MPNPYRTQRERAAYQAGLATGRSQAGQDSPKLISRARAKKLTQAQVNELWDQGVMQESMNAWARGEMLEDDDE